MTSIATRVPNPTLFWLSILACAASGALAKTPEQAPMVGTAKIQRGELSRDVSFGAELRPYQEIELHAKVTGYLDTLKVDSGDSVKEGQLIATLDVPELKIEIEHALASERRSRAEIERAKAGFDEANLGFTRIMATDKEQPHLIAQQELDAARAKKRSAEASVDAAKEQAHVAEAEVKRLRTMLEYSQITAPFAGVITKRYSDPGALIQAGTSSGALPVVRLSQSDRLRLVFPVSLSYVSNVKIGDPVEVRIASLDRTIQGKIARFSRRVDTATRTMEAEVDVPNADFSITPGIYATAVVKLDRREKALVAPIEAVTREKTGASVYVITGAGRVEERKVTVGVETPTKIEILSGLDENELVMIGSRTLVSPGQAVQTKAVEMVKAN